jgi:four helix bundle protein
MKRFAVRVFHLIDHIPDTPKGRLSSTNLLAAASSAAANYRAAQRSRSRAEFISKLSTTLEETDETAFWIELLVDTGMIPCCTLKRKISKQNVSKSKLQA